MHVEELRNEKKWETFLEVSHKGTFYHSLEWKKVIEASFDHQSLYITISDENGTVIGVCPGFILGLKFLRMYHSMPYSDYGGPVIATQHIKEASYSIKSFLQSFSSNQSMAFAKLCFTEVGLSRFFTSLYSRSEFLQGVMELDLKTTPTDLLWEKIFSVNLRRNIRLVEQRGFRAEQARTKSDVEDFYSLYCMNMKHIGATPYPYKFIENMWRLLFPNNLHIWLLEKNRRVGGMVVFNDNRKSYCVYAGIDRKQPVEVVNYLIWQEIKRAEQNGRRYVSLGSTPRDPASPYYIQKDRFGSSFYQQVIVWHPTSSFGRILLQAKTRTTRPWESIKRLLPVQLGHAIDYTFQL